MSHPHQQRCESDGCFVGFGGLLVAGCDAAPLFEAVETPFHHIAPLVDLFVEGRGSAAVAAASEPVADLVGPLGDGVGDAPAPQRGLYLPGGCTPCRPGHVRAGPEASRDRCEAPVSPPSRR